MATNSKAADIAAKATEPTAEQPDLAALKAENEAYKAQVDTLMTLLGSNAVKNTADTEEPAEVTAAKKKNAEMAETVTKTYYSRNNNEKDIKVMVNGVCRIIQLGVPVEIPKYVAEVIENSYIQKDYVTELIEARTKEKSESEAKYM